MPKDKAPASAPRISTVGQVEQVNPGVQGRLRSWIHRADRGDPEFSALRPAIIRIGRSVLIDETRFGEFLRSRALQAPAQARNPDGRTGKVGR